MAAKIFIRRKIHNSRVSTAMVDSTVFQDYHSTTLRSMGLFDDVAAEKKQEIQMNNELPSLGGKL